MTPYLENYEIEGSDPEYTPSNSDSFLDGATEAQWAGQSETFYILVWLHEEHGLKNSSNVFPLFQVCYKSITVQPV